MKLTDKDSNEPDSDQSAERLAMGEAWMYCEDCGGKLYSFDGKKDLSRKCPKNIGGRCEV